MPIIEFSDADFPSEERKIANRDKIASVRQYGRSLREWERDFLDSIELWIDDHGFLTNRQQEVLDSLYAELGQRLT